MAYIRISLLPNTYFVQAHQSTEMLPLRYQLNDDSRSYGTTLRDLFCSSGKKKLQ